jgi:hypothetical protein
MAAAHLGPCRKKRYLLQATNVHQLLMQAVAGQWQLSIIAMPTPPHR